MLWKSNLDHLGRDRLSSYAWYRWFVNGIYSWWIYTCERTALDIFSGRLLKKSYWVWQIYVVHWKGVIYWNSVTFIISNFDNFPGFQVSQLPTFRTFNFTNFPNFQLSYLQTFPVSNFPNFQFSQLPISNFPNFELPTSGSNGISFVFLRHIGEDRVTNRWNESGCSMYYTV